MDDRIVALTILSISSTNDFLVGDDIGGTSFLASQKGWNRFRELYWKTLAMALFQDKFVEGSDYI